MAAVRRGALQVMASRAAQSTGCTSTNQTNLQKSIACLVDLFQNPRANHTLSCVQAQGVYCCNIPTFIPPFINANICTSRACKHFVQSLSILLYIQRQTASIHQFCVAIQFWRAAEKRPNNVSEPRRDQSGSHGMIRIPAEMFLK